MKRILSVLVMTLASLIVFATSVFADGGALFAAKCAGCHGKGGAGDTVMGKKLNVRDLTSAEVQKQSDEALTRIITDGKEKMPAYGTKLSADEIKEIVSFIRTLKK